MDNTSYVRCARVLILHCLCFRSCGDHDETAKSTGQGWRYRRFLLRCQGEPHSCHPMEEEWQKGVRSVQLSILINVSWNVLSLDSVNRLTPFKMNVELWKILIETVFLFSRKQWICSAFLHNLRQIPSAQRAMFQKEIFFLCL